ncbi:MAG: NifB/NifX family molybdenum-iron cluster-binding protein [Planctomycetaceae bacterium]|nr:NifB/NifX family molybdenum-iron cluster-binding protein [Planctomycetaceae bacterium]
MNVAIPFWQGRVSPVFDVAANVLLVEIAAGKEQARRTVAMESAQPQGRAAELAASGAKVLICGAISRPLEMALAAHGVEVVSQTCGEIEQVLEAFIAGQLTRDKFLMPGCCGRGRRWQAGRRGGRCRPRPCSGDRGAEPHNL